MGGIQNFVTVSRRQPDFEDYIDILRRHRSWIVGPTYLGLVLAVVVAFFWPDTFESSAVLRVTPQVVSERMVPETIDLQMAQLIDSLRTKLMSRTTLTSLITNDKLKLYPRLVQRYTMEDAIAQMQKDVAIVPYGITSSGSGAGRGMAIKVVFRYTDRYKAQAVVAAIVSEFENEQVEVQTAAARQTWTFLSDKLKEAQARLDDIEGQLVKFREENAGRLPSDLGANQSAINSIDIRIGAADEKVNGLQLSRRQLEESKQAAEDVLAYLSSSADASAPAEARVNQDLVNLDRQIDSAGATLAELKQKYIDSWPQVKDQETKLTLLKQERDRMAKQEDDAKAAREKKDALKADNANKRMTVQQSATMKGQEDRIKSIQTELENYDHEIQRAQQSKLELEKQRVDVQAKINASPEIDQQYGQMIENQNLAKQEYDEMERKEKESKTTQDIEERHLGEQLELLDPALLPQTPVEPNRWVISFAGVGLGLLVGVVMAGAKEAKDTSLKNLKDVRAYTNLPVLTSIPLLENALLVRRKRRLFWLAWSTAVIVGSASMFIAMSYYLSGRGTQ